MNWPLDRDRILQDYQMQGFVIVREFCDAERLASLRRHLQRYIDEVVPRVPPMDAFYEDTQAKQQIRMLPRMEVHDPFFAELLHHGATREIAECLCGTTVAPHDAAYFNKLAEIGEATPPHQDGYYFHLNPCEALTLWFALDDVDEQNGCVRYVLGSHKEGMREHRRTQVLGFSQGIADYGTQQDVEREVPACVAAGDLIIHDSMTIHRTDPNHSRRPRRALGLVYFSSRARVDYAARDAYQEQLARELQADGKI